MTGKLAPRDEAVVFADLARLCASPGFAEAIAAICAEGNMVDVGDQLTGSALYKLYDYERLIRTEISTLVGLLARTGFDAQMPDPDAVDTYVAEARRLLAELHDALSEPSRRGFRDFVEGRAEPVAAESGAALREPFFYTGEAAFSFQYRDFAAERYGADDPWLRANRGFAIGAARDVVRAIERLQVRKVYAARSEAMAGSRGAILPAFCFTEGEVADVARMAPAKVRPILEAFTLAAADRNARFTGVQHFNATNATPLLRLADGRYLLFQIYSLAEALYESPAFWMAADRSYADTAARNRGAYPEAFARARLTGVFGKSAVHENVVLPAGRKGRRGEIDVLVVFGEVAIVVETKAKRLTLEARQGQDARIRADFQAAIQHACDQARDCATAILEGHDLLRADGRSLRLQTPIRRVFPVCLVADHYPALAAQVRRFLNWTPAEGVAPPMVTDLFALDVVAEILSSPLRVLQYLDLRERFIDKLMFNHEFIALGLHLRRNLWIEPDFDQVLLEDSLAADLDAAMSVRRNGFPGPRTPPGILTRLADSSLSRLIAQIERNPDAVELGLFLLRIGEDSHRAMSNGLEHILTLIRRDGRLHDCSFDFQGQGGITFHVSQAGDAEARERLEAHCELKKHQLHSDLWYGLLLAPSGQVRGAVRLSHLWAPDAELDGLVRDLAKPPVTRRQFAAMRPPKLRPNEPCPCGSGLKFKKCCRA